jgi:phage shock protein A
MGRFFRRLWSYLGASANAKLDTKADPKVQIQQAIEEAQRQHQQLTQQAAAVIGNQHQLEMRMARTAADGTKLQDSARNALLLADKAKAAGDATKAAEYETAAQAFAGQLVTVEAQLADLKTLHAQATQASESAKAAVDQNRVALQQKLNERSKLLTQLEQAKMQEQMNKAIGGMSDLQAPGTTPTLDAVRERIESRYATAIGSSELAHDTIDSRMLEVQQATQDASAAARLDEIRAQLTGGTPAPAAVGPGDAFAGILGAGSVGSAATPHADEAVEAEEVPPASS